MANVLNKNKGLTLIELMISITIMAILITLTLPNFSVWMLNMKVRNLVENISMGIKDTRALAIKSGKNKSFELNEDGSWAIFPSIYSVGDKPMLSGKNGNIGDKIIVSTEPSGSKIIKFNSYGSVLTYDNTNMQERVDYQPGAIKKINIELITPINGVIPFKIIIGDGGGVIVCSNPNPPKPQVDTDCSNIDIIENGVAIQ